MQRLAALPVAVALGLAVAGCGGGSNPESQVSAESPAQVKRERAEERRLERIKREIRDESHADRVLADWQDDTWFPDEVWKVKVRGSRVTIDSKLDPVQGAEFTAQALCTETLKRYDWARSAVVRYRPPSGAVAARC